MGAHQRAKGARGEREAAELLRRVYPLADRRPMQARGAARDGCDVEGTPWHVEVKRGARPSLLAALDQAERDTDGRPPLVLARQDRRGWVAVLRWEDLQTLLEAASAGDRARTMAVSLAREMLDRD